MSFAVQPKTKGDEDKIMSSLNRLLEEDPTLIYHNDQTKEIILSGMGQVHIEVTVEKMKRKFGVEVNLTTPKVPYKETIKGKTTIQGRYKKQSGGRGQYGDAWLEIEPLPRGSGFEFVDKIVGGVIPGSTSPPWKRASSKPWRKVSLPAIPSSTSGSPSLTALSTPSIPRKWPSRLPAPWPSRKASWMPADPARTDRQHRDRDSRRIHGRCHRRPEQPARPGPGHGHQGSPPDHQGPGTARGNPEIRPGPPLHDERSRNVHLRVTPITRKYRPFAEKIIAESKKEKEEMVSSRGCHRQRQGSRGEREDLSGPEVIRMLKKIRIETVRIIPDERDHRQSLIDWRREETGSDCYDRRNRRHPPGRDAGRHPGVIDKEIPGMAEAMRHQSSEDPPCDDFTGSGRHPRSDPDHQPPRKPPGCAGKSGRRPARLETRHGKNQGG